MSKTVLGKTGHVMIIFLAYLVLYATGSITFAAFLDMEKAFDKVDRNLLLLRLLQYGIDDKMYCSIKNLYVDNIARVKVNNLFTDFLLTVSSGVQQGDNLSPALFNLYINELAIELKKMNYGVDIGGKKVCLLIYADDIVIIAENESDLQIQLDFINQCCKKWRLNINHNKSNVIYFKKRNDRQSNFVFLLVHQPIYTVQTYTYLGFVFEEHVTFSECIKTRTDAARRALGGLISKCQKLKGLGYDSYCKLYDSLVVPVQDYGAEIWSIVNSKTAEKINEREMRYYLEVHNLTPLPALYGEMGWSVVKYRHHVHILRFWNRLIKTPRHR